MVKAKLHLTIISVLVLAFFALLILSTSNANISTQYEFIEELEVDDYSDLDYVRIGEVRISNTGILSSRVDLEKLVVCQISDTFGDRNYPINYQGKQTVRGKVELFSYDYYQRRVDVSAGEELVLDITVSPHSISRGDIGRFNAYNATVPFYVYEMGDDENQ